MKKIQYTWKMFDKDVRLIANWIRTKEIKAIFAIPNGGLVLGVALANRLKLPLYFNWRDVKQYEYGKNEILVVDDISDTGKTLIKFRHIKHCLTATLTVKDWTKFPPDYHVREYLSNQWISFPWEPKDKECVRDGT